MRNVGTAAPFAEILTSFERTYARAVRAPVTHLMVGVGTACGGARLDDEISGDPADVTCHDCQVSMPWPEVA